MIIHCPFSEEEGALNWKRQWLKQFDFTQVGMLDDIGRKLNQTVSQAIFSRKTGMTVRPGAL